MNLNELDILKNYSKDEASFEELKEVVGTLIRERDQKREQLALLEKVISEHYDGILITTPKLEEPGPEIVFANEEFCKITGYSRAELMGKTPRMFQGPETNPEVLEKLRKRLQEGKAFFGKTVNYRKDGSKFINQWDVHPLTDEEGHITHWVSYHHDLSGRQQAGNGFPDKMEFDSLREESQRTVVHVDTEGNIIKTNRAFRELIGYSRDELDEIKVWDLFPQKYMETLKGHFEESDEIAFFGGREFKGIIKHKNGILIQVKGKTQILDRQGEKLIRVEIESLSFQKRVMKTLKKHLNVHFS